MEDELSLILEFYSSSLEGKSNIIILKLLHEHHIKILSTASKIKVVADSKLVEKFDEFTGKRVEMFNPINDKNPNKYTY